MALGKRVTGEIKKRCLPISGTTLPLNPYLQMGAHVEQDQGIPPRSATARRQRSWNFKSHMSDPTKGAPVRYQRPRLSDSPTDKISRHFSHWSFIFRHPVEL